jgi:hypothetical protein
MRGVIIYIRKGKDPPLDDCFSFSPDLLTPMCRPCPDYSLTDFVLVDDLVEVC